LSVDELTRQQQQVALEVLGDWFINERVRSKWEALPLELFVNHQLRSIAEAANDGVNPAELELALSRNGAKQLWPHPGDAVQLLLEAPTRSNTTLAIVELKQLHESRRVRDGMAQALTRLGKDDLSAVLEKVDLVKALAHTNMARGFERVSRSEIMAPPKARDWLARDLRMAIPEEPFMVFGTPGHGKSWIGIDLAVAVATGTPFGGCVEVEQGKVLYVDFENGEGWLRRARQLVLGRGLNHPGDLHAAILPNFSLSDAMAEATLTRECQGHRLCVIDSLSACAGSVDENKPEIGNLFVKLHRVTRETGCGFLVVHHSRKKSTDPNAKSDSGVEGARGSGNITAHCSTVWEMSKSIKQGGVLHHVKSRVGELSEGFSVRLDDLVQTTEVATEVDGPHGLKLVLETLSDDELDDSGAMAKHLPFEQLMERIIDWIAVNPNASKVEALVASSVGDTRRNRAAFDSAERRGLIRNDGSKKSGGRQKWVASASRIQGDFEGIFDDGPTSA